jgi:Ca-activated chloride channel family protein
MMTFIWPSMLISLLLIPLAVGYYVRLLRRRRLATAGLGPLGLVQTTTGTAPRLRRHIPPAFFLTGLTALLVGLARPEVPISLPRVEGTVILAFDVSDSMNADDLEPSRLEAAKAAAQTFVENQPASIKIGVVAFGSGGLVVQPPTNMQVDVLATIERLSPQGGTSLGQGIATSLNAIAGEPLVYDTPTLNEGAPPLEVPHFPSAVVVLLTDGENTEGLDPLETAQVAAEAGVRIYPVGIGSPDGTVIQIDGYNIVTQLNETGLQEIASLTNGEYFHAENAETLQEIYDNIDLQLTIAGENTEITSVLAGIGALFFLFGSMLSMVWFGRLP